MPFDDFIWFESRKSDSSGCADDNPEPDGLPFRCLAGRASRWTNIVSGVAVSSPYRYSMSNRQERFGCTWCLASSSSRRFLCLIICYAWTWPAAEPRSRKRSDLFGGIACRCSGPAQATSRDAVVLGAGTQGRRPCLPAPQTGGALDESACDEQERAQGGSALRVRLGVRGRLSGGAYERPTSMDKETGWD